MIYTPRHYQVGDGDSTWSRLYVVLVPQQQKQLCGLSVNFCLHPGRSLGYRFDKYTSLWGSGEPLMSGTLVALVCWPVLYSRWSPLLPTTEDRGCRNKNTVCWQCHPHGGGPLGCGLTNTTKAFSVHWCLMMLKVPKVTLKVIVLAHLSSTVQNH